MMMISMISMISSFGVVLFVGVVDDVVDDDDRLAIMTLLARRPRNKK